MNGFLGRYEYQLDPKGRVSLPSAFRREADGERFVLLQWEKPYLTLFPDSAWQDVQRRLLEFRRHSPEARSYFRTVTSNAVEVTPDKQGRILIPSWLQAAASLAGAVLLIGAIDRVELWSPEEFGRVERDGLDESQKHAPRIFS